MYISGSIVVIYLTYNCSNSKIKLISLLYIASKHIFMLYNMNHVPEDSDLGML
jgi:hypothetical protein